MGLIKMFSALNSIDYRVLAALLSDKDYSHNALNGMNIFPRFLTF